LVFFGFGAKSDVPVGGGGPYRVVVLRENGKKRTKGKKKKRRKYWCVCDEQGRCVCGFIFLLLLNQGYV